MKNRYNEMVVIFCAIAQSIDPFFERAKNPKFCNDLSNLIELKLGLNVNAETEVQNAFIEALDKHFK